MPNKPSWRLRRRGAVCLKGSNRNAPGTQTPAFDAGYKTPKPALIILQSIPRPFDLHHSITLLARPELHQVRKPRPIVDNVPHDPLEPQPQVRRRNAQECRTRETARSRVPM